jgi:hypothetical protein
MKVQSTKAFVTVQQLSVFDTVVLERNNKVNSFSKYCVMA